MGCDIHAYLELVETHTYPDGEKSTYVGSLAKDIDIGRYYLLFALMANVRNYWKLEPVVAPRGVPADLSWEIKEEYLLTITEHGTERNECTQKDAEEYVKHGSSQWWPDKKPYRVTHPDWHSASWLDSGELKEVQRRFAVTEDDTTKQPIGPHVVLAGLIAMMDAIDKEGERKTRLVFWFDN